MPSESADTEHARRRGGLRTVCALAGLAVLAAGVWWRRDDALDAVRAATVRFLHWSPAALEWKLVALATDVECSRITRSVLFLVTLFPLMIIAWFPGRSRARALGFVALWSLVILAAAWAMPASFDVSHAFRTVVMPAIAVLLAIVWLLAGTLWRSVAAFGAAATIALAYRSPHDDNLLAIEASPGQGAAMADGVRLVETGNTYQIVAGSRPTSVFVSHLGRDTNGLLELAGPAWRVDRRLAMPTYEFEDFTLDAGATRAWHFTPTDDHLITIDLATLSIASNVQLQRGHDAVRCTTRVIEDPTARGRLFLFKEADPEALVVKDGVIVARFDCGMDVANVAASTGHGRIFWTLLAGRRAVCVLDPATLVVTRHALPSGAGDLAVFDAQDEVWISLPTRGEILVLGAGDLAEHRRMPARLGVRGFDLDFAQGTYVSAATVSGHVDVRRLADGSVITSVRVGPWLRKVRVVPGTRTALVSSIGGVFSVSW